MLNEQQSQRAKQNGEEIAQIPHYYSLKAKREAGRGRLIRNQLVRASNKKFNDKITQQRSLTPQYPKAKQHSKQSEHIQSFTEEESLHRKYLTLKKPRQNGSQSTKKSREQKEKENGTDIGNGTLSLSDGWIYKGQYISGLFHGYGQLLYHNKIIYKGRFEYGYFHGHGQLHNCEPFFFLVHVPILSGLMRHQGKRDVWLWYCGEFREGEISGFGEIQKEDYKIVGRWDKGRLKGLPVIVECKVGLQHK